MKRHFKSLDTDNQGVMRMNTGCKVMHVCRYFQEIKISARVDRRHISRPSRSRPLSHSDRKNDLSEGLGRVSFYVAEIKQSY